MSCSYLHNVFFHARPDTHTVSKCPTQTGENMMKCLSLALLFYYLQKPANNHECARIYAHLSTGCQVCHGNLKWLDLVISSAAQDRSFEYSEETLAGILAPLKEQIAAGLLRIEQSQPAVAVNGETVRGDSAGDLRVAIDRDRAGWSGNVAVDIRAAVERNPTSVEVEREPGWIKGAPN